MVAPLFNLSTRGTETGKSLGSPGQPALHSKAQPSQDYIGETLSPKPNQAKPKTTTTKNPALGGKGKKITKSPRLSCICHPSCRPPGVTQPDSYFRNKTKAIALVSSGDSGKSGKPSARTLSSMPQDFVSSTVFSRLHPDHQLQCF